MTFKKSLLGSVIAMAISSQMGPAAFAQQVVSTETTKLKPAKAPASVKKSSAVYIVQLREEPGVTFAEKNGELIPSNQFVANRGNLYNSASSRIKSYTSSLRQKHQSLASTVGQNHLLHHYVHTFNGFSARLTPKQLEALRANPDVVQVWEDQLQTPDTTNTPEFLGLTGSDGQHTLGIKGEDVIVGILDTGITPENPSFADDGSYSDPATLGWSGICDAGEETEAGTFNCNNKLIGARYFKETFEQYYELQTGLGEIISPRDSDGHGSHTASTAAGNEGVNAEVAGTSLGVMSGIAPRARVAMYKVCWNSDYVSPEGAPERGCFASDSMAAIDQAIADGVDVLNFSIGGSRTDLTYPSTAAMLRAAQAGVFVAVSAGNDGPTPETIGTPAPWVTTVGASTYDGTSYTNALDVISSDPVEQLTFIEGAITAPLLETGDVEGTLVVAEPLEACYEDGEPSPLENAGEISGNIALIARGTCAFIEKVERAQLAGASAVVVYSDDRPPTAMGGDGYQADIPGGMVTNTDGLELAAAVNSGEMTTVRMSAGSFLAQQEVGNVMADFSSRGPNAATTDVIKPDITAPGVRILAATSSTPMFSAQGQQVAYLSGTSMSSPHIAGMAALLIDQHPDWTPAQVKSALMTSARQDVTKEDGTTPADPFDFGAGHAAPVPAMAPGLTYNAGFFDYMAFMCGLGEEQFVIQQSGYPCSAYSAANYSLDPSQLNLASIAIGALSDTETIYRTLNDVSGVGGSYSVSFEGLESIDVSTMMYDNSGTPTGSDTLVVDAGSYAFMGITFAKTDATVIGEWLYGAVVLTAADGTRVRSPIAILPAPDDKIDVPEVVPIKLVDGKGSFPVRMKYSGRVSFDYTGLIAPEYVNSLVYQDPDSSFSFNEPGLSTSLFHIPEGTKVARFILTNALVDQPGADLDMYVYRCDQWLCTQVGFSYNAASNEEVVLLDPEPRFDVGVGDVYLVWVHGWNLTGADSTNFTMPAWISYDKARGTKMWSSRRAVEGQNNDVKLRTWGLDPAQFYMGTVTFFNDEGQDEGTAILKVKP
ncbi:serine protease [Alteromonas aestuariivivens]|uniref:Serine protease n=1 Tax=Alteromonas aestuariivivens TaxID=1938339 RepID=A0A3D8M469_9ALTE|nr:S8 family serine peptidase [Alteromonas aestuariivivens]RDV24446.1 serine protease [Alteromonas aestuariivivens]